MQFWQGLFYVSKKMVRSVGAGEFGSVCNSFYETDLLCVEEKLPDCSAYYVVESVSDGTDTVEWLAGSQKIKKFVRERPQQQLQVTLADLEHPISLVNFESNADSFESLLKHAASRGRMNADAPANRGAAFLVLCEFFFRVVANTAKSAEASERDKMLVALASLKHYGECALFKRIKNAQNNLVFKKPRERIKTHSTTFGNVFYPGSFNPSAAAIDEVAKIITNASCSATLDRLIDVMNHPHYEDARLSKFADLLKESIQRLKLSLHSSAYISKHDLQNLSGLHLLVCSNSDVSSIASALKSTARGVSEARSLAVFLDILSVLDTSMYPREQLASVVSRSFRWINGVMDFPQQSLADLVKICNYLKMPDSDDPVARFSSIGHRGRNQIRKNNNENQEFELRDEVIDLYDFDVCIVAVPNPGRFFRSYILLGYFQFCGAVTISNCRARFVQIEIGAT